MPCRCASIRDRAWDRPPLVATAPGSAGRWNRHDWPAHPASRATAVRNRRKGPAAPIVRALLLHRLLGIGLNQYEVLAACAAEGFPHPADLPLDGLFHTEPDEQERARRKQMAQRYEGRLVVHLDLAGGWI